MDIIRLFIIAICPGIALALALYFTDRFDREPLGLLFSVFVLGGVATIPTMFIEMFLARFNIFTGIYKYAYTAFIVAALTEEFFKRTAVYIGVYYHDAFNEKLDGIIYSAYAALGFATVENIIYVVFRYSTNPYVGLYRGLLSVPAHMLFAVTMGYYISLAKFSTEADKKKYYTRLSLVVPIILHGIFDFILMSKIQILMIAFIPFVIYLWVINLRKLNKYYHESRITNK